MTSLNAVLLGLFVQVGFTLLTSGLVRKKNAAHLVMLTFSAYVFALLAYYAVGHALQSGFQGFLLRGVRIDGRLMLDIALMLVAGYVLVGAVCERITFGAFVLCELFLGGVLYPVCAQWVWGGGWLTQIGSTLRLGRGFIDFGGSSVVHSLGGFSAMALALILGPRLGKYGRDGQPQPFLAHNIIFVTVGTLVVLFGWAGLMTALTPLPDVAARVAINVNIAAVAGAAAAMLTLIATSRPSPALPRRCCSGTSRTANRTSRWRATACWPAWSASARRRRSWVHRLQSSSGAPRVCLRAWAYSSTSGR